MISPDTSVLVAGFANWHEGHEVSLRALNRGVVLVAHTALETYSVLTRLPPPHRVAPGVVQGYLAGVTSADFLTLEGGAYRDLIGALAEGNVSGGAACDALVASTASAAGATPVTRDLRAMRTDELLGVDYELIR